MAPRVYSCRLNLQHDTTGGTFVCDHPATWPVLTASSLRLLRASPPDLSEVWRADITRFSIEHPFRFFKQALSDPERARTPSAP
jgi:hypothetical protein